MDLKAAVTKYLEAVKEFGAPMPLPQFGLSKQELEEMLSAWDEDYHLNRHFKLVAASAAAGGDAEQAIYVVNGHPYTAIIFYESIRNVFNVLE